MSPAEPVTFTLDLEDHRPSDAHEVRYPQVTREVLDFLDARDVRGTFFVVGEIAAAQPDLVREVAARGHEIGLHGWRHRPTHRARRRRNCAADVTRGKALLEDLTGRPVLGFRAPIFSLVPGSRWALDVLGEAGFTYSSSVLPARNPLFGDPSLPDHTVPVAQRSRRAAVPGRPRRRRRAPVPRRRLPPGAARVVEPAAARRVAGTGQVLWIYCHPYDFDPDEAFWVVPEAGRLGSRLLWYNRRRTFAKHRGRCCAAGPDRRSPNASPRSPADAQ